MRRRHGFAIGMAAIGMVVAGLPRALHAQRAELRLVDVRQVRMDSLPDVAAARWVGSRPTIYYNAALLAAVGPELAAFVIAHEHGHLKHGHEPVEEGSREEREHRHAAMEFEADCYAARVLADTRPAAVGAAVRFFLAMGTDRPDPWHPSGAQRAAGILACARGDGGAPVATLTGTAGRR